jgi:hypothetical protein
VVAPRLYRLRTDRLTSVNKIDYVLAHTDSWGPANLVASTVVELDDTPLYFMDDIGVVVWATHGLPIEVFT